MNRKNTTHPFPRNLICDVYGREVAPEELPSDIDESVVYVLDNICLLYTSPSPRDM